MKTKNFVRRFSYAKVCSPVRTEFQNFRALVAAGATELKNSRVETLTITRQRTKTFEGTMVSGKAFERSCIMFRNRSTIDIFVRY